MITDKFSKLKGLSRQRRYQLRREAAGKCKLCPQPAAEGGLCKKHLRSKALASRRWREKQAVGPVKRRRGRWLGKPRKV